MILDALVRQLAHRFQLEKRARVCLWFDEKEEFRRLLPALRAHLEGLENPPFRFLEYGEEDRRGQIWIRHQIDRALREGPEPTRCPPHFVVYLPLAEERLEHRGADAEPPLDLLFGFRFSGTLWRVGGKRPTLFSFLREAGVPLPEAPAEQRRLFDGGSDSLLAKYVAKFADRPAPFWATTLKPELAQSRLVGDTDQVLLDLAVDPEGVWESLRQRGLDGEVAELVSERYGFTAGDTPAIDWFGHFVAQLALTEAFLGYGEPSDFPFLDRLPPEPLRSHHVQFLRRWLRDAESRDAWDRWVRDVESRVDLSSWARGREGLSFSFPHLVRLRWEEVREEFEDAAPKTSTLDAFFASHGELIASEAELAQASHLPVGAWSLLRDLRDFLRACGEARARAEKLTTAGELVHAYLTGASCIELQHLRIRSQAEEQELSAVLHVADRAYGEYTNALNASFFQTLAEQGTPSISGVEPVTRGVGEAVWRQQGRRAVVIVDALRYDCAVAVKDALREQDVTVEPFAAMLPTVTPVGMTALLPRDGQDVALEVKGTSLHPRVNGTDMAVLSNRIAHLTAFGAHCMEISSVEGAGEAPQEAGDLLVVFGHDDVDHIGHGDAQGLVRHMQLEIERLVRLVRKLHRWGYPIVHIVTDHGFILLDEDRLPPAVACESQWCVVRKGRFALVPAKADLPLVSFPCAWNADLGVAVPPGLAFFKGEKGYSHGGASLQELIIPHLVSRSRITAERRVGVEVVPPAYELMRTAVKVLIRPRPPEPGRGGQIGLFTEEGRALVADVRRAQGAEKGASVLAGDPKEVRIEPNGEEQAVTLFFHTAASFAAGELLDLEIRDLETAEQFPPGGIKLTVGRDM